MVSQGHYRTQNFVFTFGHPVENIGEAPDLVNQPWSPKTQAVFTHRRDKQLRHACDSDRRQVAEPSSCRTEDTRVVLLDIILARPYGESGRKAILPRLRGVRCGTSFLKSSLPAATSVPAAEADRRSSRSASHQIATSSGRISHLQASQPCPAATIRPLSLDGSDNSPQVPDGHVAMERLCALGLALLAADLRAKDGGRLFGFRRDRILDSRRELLSRELLERDRGWAGRCVMNRFAPESARISSWSAMVASGTHL